MRINPAGTRWSVAAIDNNGVIGAFHPTPWEFNRESMNAGNLWYGGYRQAADGGDGFTCEIMTPSATDPQDQFEVMFLTADRFVATKNGALYRFGKKI